MSAEFYIDEFIDSANKIKADRNKEVFVPIVGSRVDDLIEASEKIKKNREASMEDPKPIKVDKFAHYKKAFICKDLFGITILVCPTKHAIQQFGIRYKIANSSFCPLSEADVESKMREIFNSGKLRTNTKYLARNYLHNGNKDIISWGTDTMNFIVNSKEGIIITSELCGQFKQFN